MSQNGGFLDVILGDIVSRRILMAQKHPRQDMLATITITPRGETTVWEPVLQKHQCSCWKCHPEQVPALEDGAGIVSIRRAGALVPRFWKTTLDGEPCCFVKEAKPGANGYVWLAYLPLHDCICSSGYACTIVLRGRVTVKPDGDK